MIISSHCSNPLHHLSFRGREVALHSISAPIFFSSFHHRSSNFTLTRSSSQRPRGSPTISPFISHTLRGIILYRFGEIPYRQIMYSKQAGNRLSHPNSVSMNVRRAIFRPFSLPFLFNQHFNFSLRSPSFFHLIFFLPVFLEF